LLNSIAGGLGSLPQIATDIAAIRVVVERDIPLLLARITFLTGTAAPNPAFGNFGLGTYLGSVLGSRTAANAEPASIWVQLEDAREALTKQLLLQVGQPSTIAGTFNQYKLISDAATQLANSLGNASTSSPNFTALAWLALIANSTERSADCCEAVDNPPPVGQNPPPGPDFACGLTGGPLRVTSFILRVTGDGGNDIYSAQFAGLAAASGSALVNVPAAVPNETINLIRAVQSHGVCLEWNLTGQPTPTIGRRRLLGASTDFAGSITTTFNPVANEGAVGVFPLNAGQHLLFEIEVPTGGPPPSLNYFLKWQFVTT